MKKNTELQVKNQELEPIQGSAEALISQAIQNNVSVDTMEKLLTMRRELRAEQAKEAFDRALADFQAECPIIKKGDTAGTGSYSFKYATLDTIVREVKPILARHGFSYTFDTRKTENSLKTICHVKHIGGHSETSEFEMAIDAGARMNVSQKDGAASSYGKRYVFVNALGITIGDEDNETELAKQPITPRQMAEKKESLPTLPAKNVVIPNGNGRIHEKEVNEIRDLLATKETKGWNEDKLLESYKITDIYQMTGVQANDLLGRLRKAPVKKLEEDFTDDDIDEANKALS